MKSAYDLANEISRTCVERIRGQYSFNIKTCSGAIEARDSEHAAALAESQKRVAELEVEVGSLKGGVNPRSMRMNNRSLRMK